jgi:hypothetical protein
MRKGRMFNNDCWKRSEARLHSVCIRVNACKGAAVWLLLYVYMGTSEFKLGL